MDQLSGSAQHVVLVSKVGLERRQTRMWFWSARQARKVASILVSKAGIEVRQNVVWSARQAIKVASMWCGFGQQGRP